MVPPPLVATPQHDRHQVDVGHHGRVGIPTNARPSPVQSAKVKVKVKVKVNDLSDQTRTRRREPAYPSSKTHRKQFGTATNHGRLPQLWLRY